MSEVADRYVEQLYTTVETLRRRGVAYYDGVFHIGRRIGKAVERAREIAEPVTYDLRDYATAATADTEPVAQIESDVRNGLVEMYLGIAVVLVGMSGGQLSGIYALPPLLEAVFDRYVEVMAVVLIPVYIYYNLRKNAALDDTERRTNLFSGSVLMGVFLGHLIGARLVSMSPATLFLPPLLFALLLDNELLVTPLPTLDRHTFFMLFGSAAVLAATLLAAISLGYFSTAVSLLNIAHVCLIFLHFQVVMQFIKEKQYGVGGAQLTYIGSVLLLQLLFAFVFGHNPDAKLHPTRNY